MRAFQHESHRQAAGPRPAQTYDGAERKLWSKLRGRQILGFKFRRQHPIGPYIADFACLERMLVIEVDGEQHGEDTKHDRERKWFLENEGFRIARFWNHDVLKGIEGVVEIIGGFLAEPPPPRPSPARCAGEGEEIRSRTSPPHHSSGEPNA